MSQSDATATEEASGSASAPRGAGRLGRFRRLRFHPLLLVLVAQALVSGRLAWVNSAFGDEAHYLYDGRLEWHDWLSGTPVPILHLSGAPQLYPPLGAAAAAAGGLPLARLASLAFMLGATALLYATAHRLFGRTAALWAAALGAFNEPVLRLAFATYDPLSVLLVMVAAYLAVRSAAARRSGELVALAGACLLLSALVAVSFAIYIPVVAAIGLCCWAERRGWAQAVVAVVWQLVLIGALAVIGVSRLHVWTDFVATARPTRGLGTGVAVTLSEAWNWSGPLVVVAGAAAVAAIASSGLRHPRGWLVAVLALAGVVVPAYQAYLGTDYSMDKHMAPGAELAAVAAGYAVSRVHAVSRTRIRALRGAVAFGGSAVLLAVPLASGARMAYSVFRQWPDTTALITAVRARLGNQPSGSLLADTSAPASFNPAIFSYYLPGVTVDSPADPASKAGIAARRYAVAVQDLNSPSLEAAAARGSRGTPDSGMPPGPGAPAALTPGLRRAVLAAATRDTVGSELAARGRYAIADVLPYVTSSAADPSGVFVIWKAARRHSRHPLSIFNIPSLRSL
ncbi:MAG: hypothetical protein J2P25_21755 [Nocardiopsaceae bacterium]|nr:hypothetical protein [Nocardiopsaceae bacterium]